MVGAEQGAAVGSNNRLDGYAYVQVRIQYALHVHQLFSDSLHPKSAELVRVWSDEKGKGILSLREWRTGCCTSTYKHIYHRAK